MDELSIDIPSLSYLICHELKMQPGEWVPLKTVARRITGQEELEPVIEGVCLSRPEIFVIYRDRKVKLKKAEFYRREFDPEAPETSAPESQSVKAPNDFWVYVSIWDVGPKGTGPYRTSLHWGSCTKVINRKYEQELTGVKNFWHSCGTLKEAERFAENLRFDWSHCSFCLKGYPSA